LLLLRGVDKFRSTVIKVESRKNDVKVEQNREKTV